ncbi:MAG TPA: DUF4410 domain-containing protein [Acidobacteriaceae bacterium]|nr:DUF4410 domain-containing protein [Acidobacteriaceae bacterium]
MQGLQLFSFSLLIATAGTAAAQTANPLWMAKFDCEAKAASAVAEAQQSDLTALQYSSLFASVTAFTAAPAAPAGAWTLTGKEVNYSGGNAAERNMVGWGAGRAHLVMHYELHDANGKIVWTSDIKTEPTFFGSTGDTGAIQNQNAAEKKQGQALVNALAKFFASQPQAPATASR